jgi:hypothetical protein
MLTSWLAYYLGHKNIRLFAFLTDKPKANGEAPKIKK